MSQALYSALTDLLGVFLVILVWEAGRCLVKGLLKRQGTGVAAAPDTDYESVS